MTEFILAITELYTPKTDGFAHLSRQVTGLVRWPISHIVSYLAHTLYAPEDDLCQKNKNKARFLARLFPWKNLNNYIANTS